MREGRVLRTITIGYCVECNATKMESPFTGLSNSNLTFLYLRLRGVGFAVLLAHADGLVGVITVPEEQHQSRGRDDALVDDCRKDRGRLTDPQNGPGESQ